MILKWQLIFELCDNVSVSVCLSQDGAFLVRDSSKGSPEQPYTLMVLNQGKVYNIHVRNHGNSYSLGTGHKNTEVNSQTIIKVPSTIIRYKNIQDFCKLREWNQFWWRLWVDLRKLDPKKNIRTEMLPCLWDCTEIKPFDVDLCNIALSSHQRSSLSCGACVVEFPSGKGNDRASRAHSAAAHRCHELRSTKPMLSVVPRRTLMQTNGKLNMSVFVCMFVQYIHVCAHVCVFVCDWFNLLG